MTVKEAHAKAAVENCKFRVAGVLRGEWYQDHVLEYVDQHGDEECTMHKTEAMISVDVNGRKAAMDLKDILKSKRIELGLTLKDVANKVGVSEGTVSRWESGEIADIKRSRIPLLAEALQISVDTLMGMRGDKDLIRITVSSDDHTNEITGKSVVAFVMDPVVQEDAAHHADAAVILHGTGDPKKMVLSAAVSLGTLIDQVTDDDIDKVMLTALVLEKLKSSVIDEETEILSTKMMSQHVSPEEDDEDV